MAPADASFRLLNSSIIKAGRRLQSASKAVSRMKEARSLEDYRREWEFFLVSWKGIYSDLEQGVKGNAQAMQWFGKAKTRRKEDQLLDYLFAARNDYEHGLADTLVLAEKGANTLIEFPDRASEPEKKIELKWKIDESTGDSKFWRPDGGPLNIVSSSPKGPALTEVKRRDGTSVFPPHVHLGKYIPEVSPLNVAELGLCYMERLISEASTHQTN